MNERDTQERLWTARTPGGATPEDRAGARLRRLAAAELPSDLALEKIRRRIALQTAAPSARPVWRRRVLVVFAACLLLIAGTALARRWLGRRPTSPVDDPGVVPRARHAAAAVPVPPAPAPLVHRAPPVSPESPAPSREAARVAAGSEKGAAPAHPRRDPRVAVLERAVSGGGPIPAPPGPETPAVPPTPEPAAQATAAESALLARALTALRRSHDVPGALTLLDEYDHGYPRGVLRGEATLARIEAYLARSDAAAALRLVDGLSLHAMPRAADTQVLRGELRSNAGRWREALSDFDDVQSGALPATLRERALYGQVVCLMRLARVDEARVRAKRYVDAFPQGRFAAEMRRLVVPPAP